MNPDPTNPPAADADLPPPLPPPSGFPPGVTPFPPPPGAARRGPRPLLIISLVVVGLVVAALGFGALAMVAKRSLNLKSPAERTREREAMRKVEAVQRENLAEQRRALEAGDATTGASDRLARAQGALGDAAKQASGEQRKAIEASQRIIAALQPKLKAYESAFAALQAAGLFQPHTMANKEAIAARRELLKTLAAANEDLAAAFTGQSAAFRAELQNAGLPAARIDAEVRGFEGASRNADQLQLREQDRQLCRTGDELLEFLSKEWGKWNIEKGGERVMFKRGDALAKFQKYAQELERVGNAQTNLQRQMLNRAQTMARPTTTGASPPAAATPAPTPR